ncbi:MAG: hypothetical protein ACYCPT_13755 [Acidimicrobiales bacterium]
MTDPLQQAIEAMEDQRNFPHGVYAGFVIGADDQGASFVQLKDVLAILRALPPVTEPAQGATSEREPVECPEFTKFGHHFTELVDAMNDLVQFDFCPLCGTPTSPGDE